MDRNGLIIFVVLLICSDAKQLCPRDCDCSDVCPKTYSTWCDWDGLKHDPWIHMTCDYLAENVSYHANSLSVSSKVVDVHSICNINGLNLVAFSSRLFPKLIEKSATTCGNLSHILHLDLSAGNLTRYPYGSSDFPLLRTLNLSGNYMGIHEVTQLDVPNLQVLDLSNNSISNLLLIGATSQLKSLYLNKNELSYIPPLREYEKLSLLDLSFNKVTFGSGVTQDRCSDMLPPNIETLLLRRNYIKSFPRPNCQLLDNVSNLKTLDLGYNSLTSVPGKYISNAALKTVEKLLLDGNEIYFISDGAFLKFKNIKYLSLSKNYLKSLSGNLLHGLNVIASSKSTILNIFLKDNPFRCDCNLMSSFQNYASISHLHIEAEDIVCSSPMEVKGQMLQRLNQSDLHCPFIKYHADELSETCLERTECEITCPISIQPVYWLSPSNKVITVDTTSHDKELNSSYLLSEGGHTLVIKDIPLALTGVYRCITNNSFSSTDIGIEVSILPSPVGSIVAIAVSSVSFALAIAINCFNMCRCYCEALSLEEEPEQEEEKVESPLKPSKRLGLHESEASLNANKYYRKYDFACQHIFLDAVVKGAHTVKQTLYDARNSEFSNNVWEYASHLRDRLHIELPSSVHMPRVSMPSISLPTISMPNISMPSMPNLQSFNSNIERLGTSVKSRSHNLASSVGSVFTLRWLKYAASDNDSDSDSEQVSMTQVEADVHQAKECYDVTDTPSAAACLLQHVEPIPSVEPLPSAPHNVTELPSSSCIILEDNDLKNTEDYDVVTFYQFETAV